MYSNTRTTGDDIAEVRVQIGGLSAAGVAPGVSDSLAKVKKHRSNTLTGSAANDSTATRRIMSTLSSNDRVDVTRRPRMACQFCSSTKVASVESPSGKVMASDLPP